jgi:hypothetical protein
MSQATHITVRVPMTIRRRPGRKTVVTPIALAGVPAVPTRADPALVKALARAFRYQKLLDEARYASMTEMAAAEKIDRGYLGRLLQLTLLAPDTVAAILDGTQDGELTLPYLMAGFDVIWACQPRPSPRPSKVPPKAKDAGRPASISASTARAPVERHDMLAAAAVRP